MIERKMPCYPIFVKDPFFSLWAKSEILTEENLVFWHGEEKPVYGFLRQGDKTLCFMGKQNRYPNMRQVDFGVSAFETFFEFESDDVRLKVSFLSPLLPDNLEILSCPTCYVHYEIEGSGEYEVIFAVDERICFNTVGNEQKSEPIRFGVMKILDREAGFFGLLRQSPLSHSNDEVGADWGYYYLLGDNAEVVEDGGRRFLTAKNFHKGNSKGKFILAFDDLCSIFYYGEWLKGYYFAEGKNIVDAIKFSDVNFEEIKGKCDAFDENLRFEGKKYGKEYISILYASLRQSMGGHKLVKDGKGRILWLSKECNSDGCIATVDVTYPSMPIMLKYNPLLLKGALTPIFDFARMDVWADNLFAPHDAGIYPYCFGQFYAAINQQNKYNPDLFLRSFASPENAVMFYLFPKENNVYEFDKQMPVEECGNMLIMSYAYYKYSGDLAFLKENADLLFKWADYLMTKGAIPDNQLCTDDFAGHLAKNVNLSIKATCGLKCAEMISSAIGAVNEKYGESAKEFARLINEFDKMQAIPLTFNDENTYSLKYNMAMDKLLGLGLFDKRIYEKETKYYNSVMNNYGTPLDSRKEYSKTDWMLWCAYLVPDGEYANRVICAINRFLKETPDRVPFSDWIETVSGKYNMFRNRTVQGGTFILLL